MLTLTNAVESAENRIIKFLAFAKWAIQITSLSDILYNGHVWYHETIIRTIVSLYCYNFHDLKLGVH